MRNLLFTFAILLVASACYPAQDPNAGLTKDQVIAYRIKGIQAKADSALKETAEARGETQIVQLAFDGKVKELSDTKSQLKTSQDNLAKKTAECTEAEKERDSMIWFFALACGCAVIGTFAKPISALGMWAIPAFIAAFVGGFSLGFGIGRTCLHFFAQFTPHLPF